MSLRVAVNCFFERHPFTGTGQYTLELLPALASLKGPEEYVRLGGVGRGFGGHLGKIWLEQVALARQAMAARADVLHYPYFAAPLCSSVPVVATVHDLIPVLLPAYRGSPLVRLYTALVEAGARRAAALIADSQSTKRDIVRRLGVEPGRIQVVYLAASSRFYTRPTEEELEGARRRYSLPERFVLYLGGLDQRKNVPRLLEAYALAKRQWGLPHALAIVGARRAPSQLFPDLEAVTRQAGVGGEVCFLGHVPEQDLPALYTLAEVFAYPSLYEGFGLPPLEAMACGTPVVCSNASSLPEVVGDAGILVEPTDVKALAEALGRVLTDEGLREDLRRRGRLRASSFSWEATAQATRRIYYEAAR